MTSRIEESGVATFLIRFKDKNENYGWSSRIQDCNLKPELTAGYIQQRNKAIWNLISLKENMIHLPLPNFILLINYSPSTNRLFHFFYLLCFFFWQHAQVVYYLLNESAKFEISRILIYKISTYFLIWIICLNWKGNT